MRITFLAMVAILLAVKIFANRTDTSLMYAEKLWELAITAKGGRQRLHQVDNLAISSIDKPPFVEFIVFPDKYFRWADTRPSKIGLIVEALNFERDIGYTIFGDTTPDVRKKIRLNQELKSRFFRPHLNYLLETKWIKPEILRAYKRLIGSKRADLVEIRYRAETEQTRAQFGDYRVGVFLDEKTHLPIRIGHYLKETGDEMYDWVDLGEYREVSGIKVPTALSSKGGRWERVQVEINIEYKPQFFEQEPNIVAGPSQWREIGTKSPLSPGSARPVSQKPTAEQIAQYIKDLESSDEETVMIAERELISAGSQAEHALSGVLQGQSRRLRYRAAKTLLGIKPEEKSALQTLRELLLDAQAEPEMRQNAAFGLMWSEAGIAILRDLLKHPQVLVRRCVIFAFDELTELTEIPAEVKPAIPILKELLQDEDEVVRGMAEEVLEQIERRPRKR